MQPLSVISGVSIFFYATILSILLYLVSPSVLAYWVYGDARARGANGPFRWTLVACTGIGLIWYLYVRGERSPEARPPTRVDRFAATWATAFVFAFSVTMVATPPDLLFKLPLLSPLFVVAFAAVALWRRVSRPTVGGIGA